MIFVFALITVIIIRYLWNQRRFYKISMELEGPMGWPIIGNALTFRNSDDLIENIQKLRQVYTKPLMRVWLFRKFMIHTNNPEVAECILNSPHSQVKGSMYDYVQQAVGDGIFTSFGEKWKKHKKMMMPSFHSYILNDNMDIFNKIIKDMIGDIEKVRGKSDCNIILHILKLHTITLINDTMLDVVTGPDKQLIEKILGGIEGNLRIAVKRMFTPLYHIDYIFEMTELFKESKDNFNLLVSILKSHLDEKMEHYVKNGEKKDAERIPFSEYMNNVNNRFSHKMVKLIKNGVISELNTIIELLTIYSAGFETTAANVEFIILMLAMHPEYQEKAFEEIKETFPDRDAPITKDDLTKMPYLDLIVKETLRLFPSAPVVTRTLTRDLVLDNKVIPAGTEAIVDLYSMQRHSEYMKIEKPNVFNPDNFLPENVKKRHPTAYSPFSKGPRICIGMRYSYIIVKMIIIEILRNYILSTHLAMEELKLGMKIIIYILNKNPFKFEKRHTY